SGSTTVPTPVVAGGAVTGGEVVAEAVVGGITRVREVDADLLASDGTVEQPPVVVDARSNAIAIPRIGLLRTVNLRRTRSLGLVAVASARSITSRLRRWTASVGLR